MQFTGYLRGANCRRCGTETHEPPRTAPYVLVTTGGAATATR
ncbi:MAG: hypothetical protein R3F55_12440 [Alphaproteobacteria bacterium]